jgi:hypothetical protein
MADDPVESAARRLYALPLDRFTPARDELARTLRKEGRREAAESVRALRKPTGAAWAVNQLAHRRAEDVRELLEAGLRLREAQRELLGGAGRGALDHAREHERALVARLAQDAAVIAAEAGLSPTPALVERIRATLHAAAADEQVAADVGAGRLVREREVVGFPAMALEAAAAAPAERRAPAERNRAARTQVEAARRAARDAARRAAAAQRALERARQRVDAAMEALAAAEAQEAQAREAARAAQAQVARLEAQLR